MPKLSLFVIPHHKNNYRAHLLKPIVFQAAICFLLLLQLGVSFLKQNSPSVLGVEYSITPQDIISQTNDQRGKLGLPALNYNPQLTVAAQAKGQDMLAKQYWAHVSPDGLEPWFFINNAGYKYLKAGENLAKDFRDSISVVNAWMNSPGHRANIVNSYYTDIGVSVVSGPFNGYDTVLVIQMFGQPLNGSSFVSNLGPDAAGAQTVPKPTLKAIARAIETTVNPPTSSSSAIPKQATISAISADPTLPNILNNVENTKDTVNLTLLLRYIPILLGSIFAGLLLIDGIIVYKHNIQRTHHGHSVLHASILIIVIVGLVLIGRGAII